MAVKRKRSRTTHFQSKKRKGANLLPLISPLGGLISLFANRPSALHPNENIRGMKPYYKSNHHDQLNLIRGHIIKDKMANIQHKRHARSMPYNWDPEVYLMPLRNSASSPFGSYFGAHNRNMARRHQTRGGTVYDTIAQLAANPVLQQYGKKALVSAGAWAVPHSINWVLNKIRSKRKE